MVSTIYWYLSGVTYHWHLVIPVFTVTNPGKFSQEPLEWSETLRTNWAYEHSLRFWRCLGRCGIEEWLVSKYSQKRIWQTLLLFQGLSTPNLKWKTNKLTLALSLRNEAQSKWFLSMDALQIIIMTSNLSGHCDNLWILSMDVKFHRTEHWWMQINSFRI